MAQKNVIDEQSINDINYELLKKQFPHAVSIDENGKYSIDPEKLQMSLDPSKANIKEDCYKFISLALARGRIGTR